MLHWYYTFLALHPRWVAFIVLVLSSVCIFVSFTFKEFPDFTDPALGFESRGTEISNRLTAWHNILEENRPSGLLTSNLYEKPNFVKPTKTLENIENHSQKKRKFGNSFTGKNNSLTNNVNTLDDTSANKDDGDVDSTKRPAKKGGHKGAKNKRKKQKQQHDEYFCDAPNREYTHMAIVRPNGNKTLLELDAMRAMCDLELKLTTIDSYKGFCQLKAHSKECCRPWSMPNYIALLSNKTSCSEIGEDDLLQMKQLVSDCYKYYLNGSLNSDCGNVKCLIPEKCMKSNAVYQIFQFLTDNTFNETNPLLSTMLFLPMAKSTKILPYYYEIVTTIRENGVIRVAAIDMGLKNALFDEFLFYDGWLIGLGAMCILYCILIYTNSILITISTVIANILSVGVAYFVYQVILQLPYFPFMNLLAIIIIVGIGADDCFVYVKEWRLSADEWDVAAKHLQKRNSKKLIYLVSNTMSHASKSILVTSLTTAHAFLASFSSSITAIRCFGLYACIVIMVNYILMVTWLPAMVIIVEEMNLSMCAKCWQSYVDAINIIIERFGNSMENTIINMVKKFKYIFLVIFFVLGISSGVIVLYYPKLGLPDSQTFQLLDSNHLFELYDNKFRYQYGFEKSFTEADTFKLPLRFVWGVEAVDDGNHLIPSSKGSIHFDRGLNISSIESQQWMLNFCKQLKQQNFYQPNIVPAILPNCFIENLIENMNKRCFDPMTNSSRLPCCEEEKFPYRPEVFEKCLPDMIESLYRSPRYIFVPGVSGPKFERITLSTQNEPINQSQNYSSFRALVIEYESTQPFSTSYTEMANFSAAVENWFNDMLKTAPNALKNGWFTSELGFYDLQQTLSSGTLIAAFIAMISSLIALLLFTMNILVSLYAVLTVIFTILSTIAVLVLLQWKLNILESIAVNTAIGLGIDFVLHYALKYQMSDKKDRKSATEYALSHMIGPTLMAAVTTTIAGIFMVFSNVLAYIQIGLFLLIVMTVSWLYATFFFASIMYTIGPEKRRTADRSNDAQAMQQLNNMKHNSRKINLKKTEMDSLT